MKINSDFKELLSAFGARNVRFMIVGGYAVGFHAEPRFTKDLDIWVATDGSNPEQVFEALAEFGAPLSGISADDFAKPGTVFQIGMPPNRIDVLNEISGGVDFNEAWQARTTTTVDGVQIHVIGVDALIRNKLATGRAQDLRDVRVLERLRAKRT